MRIRWTAIACLAAGLGLSTASAGAEPVKVVVTIQPIHSLVAGVMEGVGEPALLIRGGGSPHTYSLRPSQARALQEARVVVRVSEYLETFLNRPIETLVGKGRILTLDEAPGMVLHGAREGGVWDAHDHGHGAGHAHEGHGHDGHAHEDHARHSQHSHDDHGHDHAAEHSHERGQHGHEDHAHGNSAHSGHEHAGHGQDGDHGHGGHGHDQAQNHGSQADHAHGHGDHGHRHHHGEHDAHLWLDPANAKAAVSAIAAALSDADPAHAEAYRANARALHARLDALHAELSEATRPFVARPYIVFHDAYQYFEHRYGLTPVGSITLSPERQPGARRLSELRQRIAEFDAACVFAEPQFEPRLVHTVTEGTPARAGVLDPLGAQLEAGPQLYFELMRGLARSLAQCLAD